VAGVAPDESGSKMEVLVVDSLAVEHRLKQHFHFLGEKYKRLYEQDRSSIASTLPATEETVDTAQERSVTSLLAAHKADAGNLTDTTAFHEAFKELNVEFEKGHADLKNNNRALWKAHSYKAGSCASDEMAQYLSTDSCGWICFSNSVPWFHRWQASSSFYGCLAKTSTGPPMSSALQAHVFAVWYDQDMHTEVEYVYMRFKLIGWLIVMLVTCSIITWKCGWSAVFGQSQTYYPQYAQQSMSAARGYSYPGQSMPHVPQHTYGVHPPAPSAGYYKGMRYPEPDCYASSTSYGAAPSPDPRLYYRGGA